MRTKGIAGIALAAGILAAVPPFPVPAVRAQQPGQTVDLKDWSTGVELAIIVDYVSKQTKKTILFGDEQLRTRKIYLHAPEPVPVDSLFPIFLTMLRVHGFQVVEVVENGHSVHKIFSAQQGAKERAKYLDDGETAPLDDTMVSRLFTLKYISPRDVQAALLNLVTDPKNILPLESSGMVFVTEYGLNMDRIARIITTMDVKRPDIEFEMLQLHNALATDLEPKLTRLVQTIIQGTVARARPGGQAQGPEQVQIVADERTNSIVVLAEPQRKEQIRELVAKLDIEIPYIKSRVRILHLKHTNAKVLSETINLMYYGQKEPRGLSGKQAAASSSNSSQPGQPGGSPQPSAVASLPGRENAEDTFPTIVPDEETNSLIVVADQTRHADVEQLVGKLDVRRPQVLIQATIVEVTATQDFDLGLELATLDKPGENLRGFARSANGLSTLVDTDNDKIPDAIVPVDTQGVTLGLFKDSLGKIPALLKALQTDIDLNIVSVPEAVTNDNVKATLKVTDQVPTTTQSVLNNQVITSFQGFQDAGITLEITPHIGESSTLRLETYVKVEKFTGRQTNQSVPPPKATREITTQVVLPNFQTLVIGGLTGEDNTETVSGIPFLKDIPVLGNLFRRTVTSSRKTTLYLFITPYILYDERFDDALSATQNRYVKLKDLRNGRDVESIRFGPPPKPVPTPVLPFATPYKFDKK